MELKPDCGVQPTPVAEGAKLDLLHDPLPGQRFATRIRAWPLLPIFKERIFWYAYQFWFAVLALTLLRERSRNAAAT